MTIIQKLLEEIEEIELAILGEEDNSIVIDLKRRLFILEDRLNELLTP